MPADWDHDTTVQLAVRVDGDRTEHDQPMMPMSGGLGQPFGDLRWSNDVGQPV